MTVFKACMKIAKNKMPMTIIYISIFVMMLIGIQKSGTSHSEDLFNERSVKIGIINEDKGELSKGLCEYLSRDNEVTYEKNDKSILQEKMYYRDLEYIIWIPENFVKKCIEGTDTLKVMVIPEEMTSNYMASKVNSYLSCAKIFYNAGLSTTEIIEKINAYEKPEVIYTHSKRISGYKPFQTGMVFMPYILMGILFFTFGSILISFNRKEIHQRCQATSLTPIKKTMQMLFALSLYSLILWMIIMMLEILIFGKAFINTPYLIYYVINSLVLLVVTMSMAYLIGSVIKNINYISVVINIVSLGMSFLCGVFVNLELLPSQVVKVAMFLPVYWYEKSCLLLKNYSNLSNNIKFDFYKYQGIQLLFAVSFIMIALVISKNRRTKS